MDAGGKSLAENYAAQMKFREERELYHMREVLIIQLVGLYSRWPYAATELRDSASATLNDPKMVEKLMDRLKEKGALKDDKPKRSRKTK